MSLRRCMRRLRDAFEMHPCQLGNVHCVKYVQIRSYLWSVFPVFGPNIGKYGPKITPHLDPFHAVVTVRPKEN